MVGKKIRGKSLTPLQEIYDFNLIIVTVVFKVLPFLEIKHLN
jgi:hypothetical protein